jgi:hypothetical protein
MAAALKLIKWLLPEAPFNTERLVEMLGLPCSSMLLAAIAIAGRMADVLYNAAIVEYARLLDAHNLDLRLHWSPKPAIDRTQLCHVGSRLCFCCERCIVLE